MVRNFDYLRYTPPSEPVQTYVDNAIAVLLDIQSHYPQFYKQFICPSEVLTLSGVRAFDTYYELGTEATEEDIVGLKNLLKRHSLLLLEEAFDIYNQHNEEHHYSLVHIPATLEIPERYKRLTALGWVPPNFTAVTKDTDFFLWWFLWKETTMSRADSDATMAEWFKRDCWTAHNLTFGVLLGYPGEAICSALYATEQDSDEERAKVEYGDTEEFDGAQPIYFYLRDVADDPHIKRHEDLWSSILTGVYAKLEPQVIATH